MGKKIRKPDDNTPKVHHYVPAFYLRRFVGSDGKLFEYSKPYGNALVIKPVKPESTGFVENLYALRGLPPVLSQQIEEKFLRPVDTQASHALRMLHREISLAWSNETRSAWARFVFSLLVRMPEHIYQFRDSFSKQFYKVTDREAADYVEQRTNDMPATASELFASISPDTIEQNATRAWAENVNHSNIVLHIMNMEWSVLNVESADFPMLCSDRPYIMTNGLTGANTHICLPISPGKLFLATPDLTFRQRLCRLPADKIAKAINRSVVGQSVKYVYSNNQRQNQFIANRMSTMTPPSLFSRLRT